MKQAKPITILFDANPMVDASKSGVGYFTSRLIAALATEHPRELKLIGHYYNFLGRKKDMDMVRAPNISYRQTKLLPGKVFNGLRRLGHIEIPLELLARRKADVLFFPNFAILPSLFGKPRIVVIHDLYFTEHPEHINQNNVDFLQKFVPAAIQNADLVVTMSNFTRQAVIDIFGTAENKLLTISIPPSSPVPVTEKAAKRLLAGMDIHKDYVLFVGNLEPRKNLISLVEAYRKLPENLRAMYGLVLAGGKGWNDEALLRAIDSAKASGLEVTTPGYVSDEQKAALFQEATMLVMPSHYEGFGMQILEAMSYHVPTAISDIPVFHEVAGDASLYFDKDNPEDVAACIERLLRDPALRHRLVKKGDEVLKKYDWRAVAKDVFNRLEGVVHG